MLSWYSPYESWIVVQQSPRRKELPCVVRFECPTCLEITYVVPTATRTSPGCSHFLGFNSETDKGREEFFGFYSVLAHDSASMHPHY